MIERKHLYDITGAIARSEARQTFLGKRRGAMAWQLSVELESEMMARVAAWTDAHGGSGAEIPDMLQSAAVEAGKAWKRRNKTGAIEILLWMVGGMGLLGLLASGQPLLFGLIGLAVVIFYCIRILKGYRSYKLRSLWKQGGSYEQRLDQMAAVLQKKVLSGQVYCVVICAVLAIPFLIGVVDGKFYPYLLAEQERGRINSSYDYYRVAQAFDALGDYRDSKEKASAAWISYGDDKIGFSTSRDDAFEAYKKAGASWKIGEYYYGLAEKALTENDFSLAIAHFGEAGKYKYSDAEERQATICIEQADALLAAGDEEGAIVMLRKVTKNTAVKEKLYWIHMERGNLLREAGDPEAGATSYEMAYNLIKDDFGASAIKAAYTEAAEKALAANEWQRAVTFYQKAGEEALAAQTAYHEAVYHYEKGNYAYASMLFAALEGEAPEGMRSVADYRADEKLQQIPKADFLWLTKGSVVQFGRYEQDGNAANGAEPIEWVVLDTDGEKSMLMSVYALDYCQEKKDKFVLEWADSPARAWLNSTFMESAFTPDEQARLCLTLVRNDASQNGSGGISAGPDTQDYLFAMSYLEASTLIPKEYKDAVATAAALAGDVDRWQQSTYIYLRSLRQRDNVNYVERWCTHGNTMRGDAASTIEFHGAALRPAMWVKVGN